MSKIIKLNKGSKTKYYSYTWSLREANVRLCTSYSDYWALSKKLSIEKEPSKVLKLKYRLGVVVNRIIFFRSIYLNQKY